MESFLAQTLSPRAQSAHISPNGEISSLSAKPGPKEGQGIEAKARQAAEDFESVFLTEFVEQMFSGIKTDGPFGGGQSEEIYRSMMSEQYARQITRSGGIGIADNVYSELLKAQEGR